MANLMSNLKRRYWLAALALFVLTAAAGAWIRASAAEAGQSGWRAAWVLREDDCLTCESFAAQLRRLQAAGDFGVTLYLVGASSITPAESILRRERIEATIEQITQFEALIKYHGVQPPMIVLFKDGVRRGAYRNHIDSVVVERIRTELAGIRR